jgi:phosphohistidine swiveling domain-containing protein
VFTRSLSDAMALFKEVALENGYTAEDCSYASISCISQLYSSSLDTASVLRQSIEEGKKSYELTRQITLPPLITSHEDVWAFQLPQFEPNFITLKSIVGNVVCGNVEKNSLKGAILMIPSADPGYDWIFSQGIAGFITMYGGVNSHMAIRAGELGIPAVIGAGEALYTKWQSAKVLEIDCANKQVRILR